MEFTRRDLCSLIPAVLLPGAFAVQALAGAQSATPDTSATNVNGPTGVAAPIESGAYTWDSLVPHQVLNGTSTTRPVFKGRLATGESVELHETTVAVGGAPHPPHRHLHSEMFLVREGTMEFTVNGKGYKMAPGSAGFASSNDEHGVKNAGDTPLTYFVVAVGPGSV